LHRFDYDDALAGFDFRIFRDEQTHDASGHGSENFSGALLIAGILVARAQGVRIAQLDPEAGSADPHMEIGRNLLALNFVGVAIDQQGQNVAARDHRVYVDRLPVQTALPPGSGSFKLYPARFAARSAAYDDFINHKDQRSPSDRPFCFQLDGAETCPVVSAFLLPGEVGSSTANIPAAIAAIVSSSSIWGSAAAEVTSWLPFASKRSRYPVSSFPSWKSASLRMRWNKETLVLMPATKYSPSARCSRMIACSRSVP